MVGTSRVRAYHSWWQARSDAWSQLEEASGQLASAARSGQSAAELIEVTSGLLDALTPVERSWAFPGPEARQRARDLFDAASYERFASLVAQVNRALVDESYRTGDGWPATSGGTATERPADRTPGPARPYFEVLVVEQLTPAQEHALREEVRSWRRPSDHFVYELVIVGNAEDALIAARLNTNLKACLIRRGLRRQPPTTCPTWPSSPTAASPPTWLARRPMSGPRSWPAGWPGCGRNSICT